MRNTIRLAASVLFVLVSTVGLNACMVRAQPGYYQAGYVQPRQVYVQRPVYAQPQQVYVQPQQVYVQPQPTTVYVR